MVVSIITCGLSKANASPESRTSFLVTSPFSSLSITI